MEFVPFPKLSRLFRDIVVTEKIDGTNAQITFDADLNLYVGSRNRWITPDDDNFGFARWCHENVDELRKLGPGSHFGEWWGRGIQRGYGLDEKRFSLFNTGRWYDDMNHQRLAPACCHVVPVLYMGPFEEHYIRKVTEDLRTTGSKAAPGFMQPEGVVIFHTHSRELYKYTLDKNDKHKWEKAHET